LQIYERAYDSFNIPRDNEATLLNIVVDGVFPRETITGTNLVQVLLVPLVLPAVAINNHFLGYLKILGYTLYCVVVITNLVFVSWTWCNRKNRVVTASQPLFLYLILAGTIIFSSSIITFTIDDENHSIAACSLACTLDVWFLSIGFTVIFAALYSKAWRVNKIMRESSRFKRVKIMPKDVILPFVMLLIANVAILLTWTIQDRHYYSRSAHPGTDDWNRDFSFYGRCTSLHAEIYYPLILAVNLIALVMALYETYKTRKLRTEFNESAYIGIVFICIRKFNRKYMNVS
jgi:gamma-aminobutyric acid type B receptor